MDTDPRPRVSFTVDDDADAHRIAVVLEALGFETVRSMESSNALHWGITRLVRRHSISPRERIVLEMMLTEQLDDQGIARRMRTGVSTVAFLRGQVLVKAGVADREQLLRLALQLPVGSGNNPARVG